MGGYGVARAREEMRATEERILGPEGKIGVRPEGSKRFAGLSNVRLTTDTTGLATQEAPTSSLNWLVLCKRMHSVNIPLPLEWPFQANLSARLTSWKLNCYHKKIGRKPIQAWFQELPASDVNRPPDEKGPLIIIFHLP